MSGPSTGIGRITQPYTVSGLTHVCRMYVANPTLSAGTWRIDANPLVGGNADWADAADSFAATLSYMLATGVTPGTALLEEYSATGWLPRDTHTTTFPNLSGSTSQASQLTLTLRDSNFTRPKIVLMEVNNPGPLKFNNPGDGGANVDDFIEEFLASGSLSVRPYHMMVNQHEFFLQDDPFVSATITYNHRIRKARGLA